MMRWKHPNCIARLAHTQSGWVVLSLCLGFAFLGHGQDRQDGQDGLSRAEWSKRIFESDQDANGQITLGEASAHFEDFDAKLFEWLDRDRSGIINRRDFTARSARSRLGLYRSSLRKALESDTNGDGLVTFRELRGQKPGYPRENFDRLDADENGTLSRADMKALKDAVDRGEPDRQTADPRADRRRRLIRRIMEADSNGDGQTSFEEAAEKLPRLNREIFRRLDRNGDGFVAEADLRGS